VTTAAPTERTLRHRAEMIVRLLSIDGFDVLVEEMEKKRLRMERALMGRVMAEGMSGEALQRQADYDRGFVAGMRYAVIAVPEDAVRVVQRGERPAEMEEEAEDIWA